MDNAAVKLEDIAVRFLSCKLPYLAFLSNSSTSIARTPLEICNCLLGALNIHLNQYADKD